MIMNNALVAGLKGGARLKKAQLGGGVNNAAPKKSGMTGMVANAVASRKAAKSQTTNRGYVKTGVQTTPPRKRMAAAKRKPAQPTSGPKPRLGW